ncbi:MAG: hypothetical protein HKP61_01055 [Dactylosporangium sp.]|nr:hypothetical protein [Dactylosporangium sp.]NNJ59559.1 hypothetical protein [Dactylosporangium sp.]
MSVDGELVERVRALRATGCTAKQIARTLEVPAARVTALVRAIAAGQVAAAEADDGPPRWSAAGSVRSGAVG